MARALKVKLGKRTLTDLAKRFGDGPFPAKWKDHDGRVRLILTLQKPPQTGQQTR